MHIKILTVGDNKFDYLKAGENIYLSRLSRYVTIQMESVISEKITKSKSDSIILKIEADRLRRKITDHAFLCILDSRGKKLSSEEFARTIQSWQNRSISNLVFCIGGAVGLHDDFINQADFVLSMSAMTFPHDMARLIFLEQLYRAYTILKGEKYHK